MITMNRAAPVLSAVCIRTYPTDTFISMEHAMYNHVVEDRKTYLDTRHCCFSWLNHGKTVSNRSPHVPR